MESKKINYPGLRQAHGPSFGPSFGPSYSDRLPPLGLLLTLMSLLLCSLAGCPGSTTSKSKIDPNAKVGRRDLPPLKIGVLDCDEISEVLQRRWQEYSDQQIELVKLNRQSFASEPVPALDVVLYPANFLGSLSEKDWIAPLPTPLLERLGGGKKGTKTNQDLNEEFTQGIETWSSRWRTIARYNGRWMALPLGAPCWVAVTRGLDIEPLKQLHQAIGSNQNSPKIATDSFESFLAKAESTLQDSLESRRELLAKLLQDRQAIDKRALVERFLWIMSTSESRYRGLIDPYKVTPRLGLQEFARSAHVLHRLALIEPRTMLASPVDAWEKVAEGQAVLGIGWPRTDGFQRASLGTDAKPLKMIPILFNGGNGILASIGRKTRQSATATEFMYWINREDNRVALQAKSPRIEVLEIDNDVNRIRDDYREYQTLQRLEAANTTLDMTPRFLNADPLIDSLGEALLDIIEKPESSQSRLEECKAKWTELIEATGVEYMRGSLERSSGSSN